MATPMIPSGPHTGMPLIMAPQQPYIPSSVSRKVYENSQRLASLIRSIG